MAKLFPYARSSYQRPPPPPPPPPPTDPPEPLLLLTEAPRLVVVRAIAFMLEERVSALMPAKALTVLVWTGRVHGPASDIWRNSATNRLTTPRAVACGTYAGEARPSSPHCRAPAARVSRQFGKHTPSPAVGRGGAPLRLPTPGAIACGRYVVQPPSSGSHCNLPASAVSRNFRKPRP